MNLLITTFGSKLSNRGNRRAMTLLELLVVLVILTVVATIAVSNLQPRVDVVRFEQTQKLLRELSDATLGPTYSRQADGTPLLSGFVADVGRSVMLSRPVASSPLERDRSGTSDQSAFQPGSELRELWDPQSRLAREFPYQFRSGPASPVNYSDVKIPCGWRVPYLQLAGQAPKLHDGWGKPLEYHAGTGGEVEFVVANVESETPGSVVCDLTSGKVNVSGTINFDQTLPTDLQVTLLLPDPEFSKTELAIRVNESLAVGAFHFSGVPVGLRAICVVVNRQRLVTKYIQVPHQGVSLVIDLNGKLETTHEQD